MWHAEFRHPRLVEVYDLQCTWSREDDFFLAFANETPGANVADLGCGTGRLTLALAQAGHRVTGVDPAAASLAAARAKPGAERVTWIEGTSASLPSDAFDVVLMTAHVAQFLVDDAHWHGTLRDVHRALAPGGRLVFDTRDPRARGWEHWNPRESHQRLTLRDRTSVDVWTDVTSVSGDLVEFAHNYAFSDGDRLVSTASMRFRSEDDVRAAVAGAGLTIYELFGGWAGEAPGTGDGELLVLARRDTDTDADARGDDHQLQRGRHEI